MTEPAPPRDAAKRAGPKKPRKAKAALPIKARKQVAALPVCLDPEGRLRVLLETSRESKRFIIPKGWTEKGMKDWQAAALEAREEAGLKGRISRKPIGDYTYWKRLPSHFEQIKVKVFVLEAERQMAVWREKGQRDMAWFLIEDAVKLVDEPGMIALLQDLPKKKLKARSLTESGRDRGKPGKASEDADAALLSSTALKRCLTLLAIPPEQTPLRDMIEAWWLPANANSTEEERAIASERADQVLAEIVRVARLRR